MDEKNKMNKKSIVIGATSLLLVTLLLLGLTYAYYKTKIVGNSNEKSVSVISKNLSVTYQNESAYINAEGIEPGYTATKTFEVKNTGSETVEYSVMLDNVTNTFTRDQDWEYTLTKDETEVATGTIAVGTHQVLIGSETLASGSTTYKLEVTYVNSDEDQSEDMGESLSFRVNISDETQTWDTAISGTLLYAIKNSVKTVDGESVSMVVSTPTSIPGRETNIQSAYSEAEEWSETLVLQDIPYSMVYGSEYSFDPTTGLYHTSNGGFIFTEEENVNALEGMYTADISGELDNSANTLYKIISVTEDSLTYQKKGTISNNNGEISLTQDDYGTSYYFRGNVTNNYVNYSGMCWRIVRVQGDGTIKLALADENGECNAETYSVYNTKSAFINSGTTYSYISNYSMTVSDFLFGESDILTALNNWADSKSLDTSKLADTEWCNDTAKTISGDFSYYGAYSRLDDVSSANPTLKCNTKGIDGTSGIEVKAQRYIGKIALLTADEIAFAGSTRYQNGTTYNYYLKTNASSNSYWSMSPFWLFDSIRMFEVGSDGSLELDGDDLAVRPSIVLNSNVTISSGDGTQTNPYVIS